MTLRSAVLIALVALCAAPALSQPARLAVRVGYASSTFTPDDVHLTIICCADQNQFESRGGFEAAVALAVPVSERLAFRPEVAWVHRGARQTLFSADTEFDFRYLELSALGQLRVAEVGPVRLVAEAGPTASVLVDERAETLYIGGPYGDEFVVRDDLVGTTRSYFGAAGGLALQFAQHLSVGARYSRGLTPFVDRNQYDYDGDTKHTALSFGIGYDF